MTTVETYRKLTDAPLQRGLIGSAPAVQTDEEIKRKYRREPGFPVPILIAPATVWLIVFLFLPLISIFIFSFWKTTGHGMTPAFTLEHYQAFFATEGFFDPKSKVQCVKCHAIEGEGGRVGPPLDHIASRRAPEFIMESILQPSKDIDPQYEAIQVVTNQGLIITGLRVNETNFSVQLREENGRFHSFEKRELESVQVLKKSLMPEDVAEHLSVKELHDLFAFLLTLE